MSLWEYEIAPNDTIRISDSTKDVRYPSRSMVTVYCIDRYLPYPTVTPSSLQESTTLMLYNRCDMKFAYKVYGSEHDLPYPGTNQYWPTVIPPYPSSSQSKSNQDICNDQWKINNHYHTLSAEVYVQRYVHDQSTDWPRRTAHGRPDSDFLLVILWISVVIDWYRNLPYGTSIAEHWKL